MDAYNKNYSSFYYKGLSPTGKALVDQIFFLVIKKHTKVLSSWTDPGIQITKFFVVGRTLPPLVLVVTTKKNSEVEN